MTNAVIGLDTSNYRTSLAVVSLSGDILLDLRKLLPVATGERGLRQSDAVYAHLKTLKEFWPQFQSLAASCHFCGVCASVRPRDRADSYMPVFEVGDTVGRGLSASMNIPFFQTDHQHGHLRAAQKGTCLENVSSYLAVHLSGGTTDLLRVQDHRTDIIGGSLDLHAGQLIDRIGVAMGLKFPSGPEMEMLAQQGLSKGQLGCSMERNDFFCHFSGAEAKAMRLIQQNACRKEDLAREVFDLLSRTIARMLAAASRDQCVKSCLICGGVSSSSLFRQLLAERLKKTRCGIKLVFGEPAFSGDNAVGVALIGTDRIRRQKE